MKMDLLGKIAGYLGMLALLWGIVMMTGIIPMQWLFGVTPGGSLDGAVALFLMALVCFTWPWPEEDFEESLEEM